MNTLDALTSMKSLWAQLPLARLFQLHPGLRVGRDARARQPLYLEALEDRSLLSATITGVAFQDFNANGVFETSATIGNQSSGSVGVAQDVGVGGVTVQAFDANNVLQATTTTSSAAATLGQYTLSPSDAGTSYRIEFSGFPVGFTSGPHGVATGPLPDASGSSVQFVGAGATNHVDLGLVNAAQFTQNNPPLVSQQYWFGGSNGLNAAMPTIVSVPYSAGAQNSDGTLSDYQAPASTTLANVAQVGATWGLAYSPQTQTIYAAAYMKKHTGFGPGGTGAIYQVSPTGATAPSVYVDLNALFGAGTAGANPHDTSGAASPNGYFLDNGNATFDAVGKIAIGGIDVSTDGKHLYALDLANRTLYDIPLDQIPTAANIRSVAVPLASVPGATGVNGDDIRPFAVKFYQGKIYIGMVNTAESTTLGGTVAGDPTKLQAYVYTVDPGTLTFSAAPVVQFSLNYPRGQGFVGETSSNWLPWSPVWKSLEPNPGHESYPQPMFTGIAFDPSGNMVLGFRDRFGDQTGNYINDNPALPNNFSYRGVGPGDVYRAFINTPGNLNSGWTLESNAAGPNGQGPTGGANNGRGLGGGQYYYEGDLPGSHNELGSGGVLQLPGFPDVVTTSEDPTRTAPDVRSAGFRWFNNTTGQLDKAYELYPGTPGAPNPVNTSTFGKSNGAGDLIAIPGPAPLEIGNRVWDDVNGNGIQDANEPGISGVTVQLFDGNTLVGTTTTDSSGDYYFNNGNVTGGTLLPNHDYQVRIATGQAALSALLLTTPNNPADVLANSKASISGLNAVINVTTGAAGDSDHTFDAGFVPLSLGDTVWVDANNDGKLDNGETGLDGVLVALLHGDGTAVLDGNGNAITTTTANGGKYLFTNLLSGSYKVRITPPAGYISSTGTNNLGSFEPGSTDFTDAGNNTDHGTEDVGGATITSQTVTLGAPGSAQNPDGGGTANLNVDFGVFQPLSLGDTVWVDANNDGKLDNNETGLDGVTVALLDGNGNAVLDGSGNAVTTTTANGGKYLFTGLLPGSYEVRITPPAGYVSSTGTNNLGSFEPGSTDFTDNGNNTDHGTEDVGGATITSGVVTLAASGSLQNPDNSHTANLNVDFGVFQPLSLGDTVWVDANNDGKLDNNETGLDGVAVALLDSNGNAVLNGSGNAITTTTANGGKYLFTNLLSGSYKVRITPPAGYISSTGTNGTGSFEPGSTDFSDLGNNTDHGTEDVGGATITSGVVTLGAPGSNLNPDSNHTANLNVDFGVFQPLSLGDTVWVDANNDGKLDNNETGLDGVAVALLDSNGNAVLDGNGNAITMTTANGGKYLFTGLTPGTYKVRITPPAGYVSSTGTNGTGSFEPGSTDFTDNGNNTDHGTEDVGGATITSGVVTLAASGSLQNPDNSHTANLNVDFGVFQPLSLGDFVWVDANNDGKLDNNETGLDGVAVALLDGNGNAVLDGKGNAVATTTANGGKYLFTDLLAGQYKVRITPPAGYVSSTGANGSAVVGVEPGSSDYTDNGNNKDHGTEDASGLTITSQTVTLTAGATNPDNAGPGGAGTANTNVDFGIFQTLSIGNVVFNDANNDGTQDNGEQGLAGVTVNLRDNLGGLVATTTTNAQGGYLFTDLTPGTYRVEVVTPAGFLSSTGSNGFAAGPFEPAPNNNVDNQDKGTTAGAVTRGGLINLQFGTQPTGETATPGGIVDPALDANSNFTQDFGFFQPLALGDKVFVDANNDGVLDHGEPGLDGVTVALLYADGTPVVNNANTPLTTITSGGGNYLFADLTPGQYEVRLTPPAGYVSSTGMDGSATGPFEPGSTNFTDAGNNTDHGTEDVGGATVTSGPVTLTAAGANPDAGPGGPKTANRNVDFGVFQPAGLSGVVFADPNNNGIQDPGDPGIGGVTITLTGTDFNGDPVAVTTVTAADGSYHFTDLTAGSYTLSESQPPGYVHGQSAPGQQGADPGTGLLSAITLRTGVTGQGNNFGEIPASQTTPGIGSVFVTPGLLFHPLTPTGVSKANLLGSDAGSGAPMAKLLADTAFVNSLYADVLGRAPDQPGLDHWVSQLQAGVSRAAVADSFWRSGEHRGLEVDRLYHLILHRTADATGRAGWVQMLTAGSSENDVARALLGSAEYTAAHPDARSFLVGLYTDILGHAPDIGGLLFWQNALQSGSSRDAVAAAILGSTENLTNVVDTLYLNLLGRRADAPGEQGQVASLARGATLESEALVLLSSDEYYGHATARLNALVADGL